CFFRKNRRGDNYPDTGGGTSRLFEKGFSIMEAASITGHKTMSMLKRYTHLCPDTLADKLG
ncbi:site-specific recombinase, phage integrase family protein, partial [Pseudomonas syringae pv. actinidiae ICMP 19070]